MSKVHTGQYGFPAQGMMTSAELFGDDSRTLNCDELGVVAGGGSGKMIRKKRRRRLSLASRNLDEMELQMLRQKINGRERLRMHDLNSALDGLREVALAALLLLIELFYFYHRRTSRRDWGAAVP